MYILLLIICVCMTILCLFKCVFSKSNVKTVLYALLMIFFETLFFVILAKSPSAETSQPAQYGPEKTVYTLSFYVQDGATESEDYILEVTEQNTYKLCYFQEDGVHVTKLEIPVSMTELICDDADYPYRVETYYRDGQPVLYQLHIPDNAEMIQLDLNND